MLRYLEITVFLLVCSSGCGTGTDNTFLSYFLPSFLKQSSPQTYTVAVPETTCTGCSQKIALVDDEQSNTIQGADQQYTISDSLLTTLRIEYIKNQILKKLRLKEKPAVSLDSLPQILKENEYIMSKIRDNGDEEYSDDFYAKTTRAIVFPYEDAVRCSRRTRYPSACLPFQLPSDISSSDVSSAELWFYKLPDAYDSRNQTIVITEIAHWDSNVSFQKNKAIAIKETSITEGWVKVNVDHVIMNWLRNQDYHLHALNLVCKTCHMPSHNSPISSDKATKPFLIIYTHTPNKISRVHRKKRNTNCAPGVNECCRESLYMSFEDVGWSDWIIQPAGYNAYFCKGSCATAASVTLMGSQHNYMIQKFIYSNKTRKSAKLELKPCCAPTRYKPLQLLYMNNNKTVTSSLLSNMIAESCGCM